MTDPKNCKSQTTNKDFTQNSAASFEMSTETLTVSSQLQCCQKFLILYNIFSSLSLSHEGLTDELPRLLSARPASHQPHSLLNSTRGVTGVLVTSLTSPLFAQSLNYSLPKCQNIIYVQHIYSPGSNTLCSVVLGILVH